MKPAKRKNTFSVPQAKPDRENLMSETSIKTVLYVIIMDKSSYEMTVLGEGITKIQIYR